MLHSIRYFCFLLLLLAGISSSAHAEDYDALIKQGLKEKTAGDYAAALRHFGEAKAIDQNSSEVWYLEGVIYSFQKKYDTAIEHLKKAIALDANNSDARLQLARTYRWQGNIDAAKKEYNNILAAMPGNKEAAQDLAKLSAPVEATAPIYRWQVDTGYGTSGFSRVPQQRWHDAFLQLNYKTSDGASMVHGKYNLVRRFGNENRYYEAGVDHRFNPDVSGYLSLGGSPEANFLPKWKVLGGGSYRILHKDPLLGDTLITLDAIYDNYTAGDIQTINPGIQYYATSDIWLSAKHINVITAEDRRLMGWFLRGDWQALEHLRLNAGVADAPDTVNGVPINTRSRFAGLAFDIVPSATLYLGFARDDRKNSYIEKTVSSGLSVRF